MDEWMDKNLLPLSPETERYKSHLKGKHSSLWSPVSQYPHHNNMSTATWARVAALCIVLHHSAALCSALHLSASLCIALQHSASSASLCLVLHWKPLPVGVSGLGGKLACPPLADFYSRVSASGVPGERKLLLPLRPFWTYDQSK